MCNACGFYCCALDSFDRCGCEHCENPECWDRCDVCGEDHHTEEHYADESEGCYAEEA